MPFQSSSVMAAKQCSRLTCLAIAVVAVSLTACGGSNSSSGSSSGPGAGNGSLVINQGMPIQVSPGVAFSVPVSLQGGTGVTSLVVDITSSDTTVATVYPDHCTLSSVAGQDSCQVIVHGLAPGNVSLNVSAAGYTAVMAPISLQTATTPNYGEIQIGAFPSANPPSTTTFNMTAQQGSIVTLAASITGFNTPLDGVPIVVAVTSGDATIVGNPQCNVDSGVDANHYCLYKVQMPAASGAVTLQATAVGATAPDFAGQAPTVQITVQAAPVPGTLVLQSTGAGVPLGMSSPFWAVLQDSSGVGDTTVSLTATGGVTVNPGVPATATGAYKTDSCTLSSSNPVCGFGAKGTAIGAASVSATAPGYIVNPLGLAVIAPKSASRTITFNNTSSDPVWVGITGGTATSYLTKDMVTTINPQTNGANVTCGPSNAGAACPTGSTCQQGGANPGPKTTYFCYWDQPTPASGYEIATGVTGVDSATAVSISDSSYDPVGDIIWSGNFYPRQGCTTLPSGELTCTVADCGNATSGSACAPGTGGSPGIATLEEITLQGNATDYYDISIIGGANVKTTFGPSSTAGVTPSGYSCGTAGLGAAQGTLLGSDWDMAAHVQTQFPTVSSTEPYSETGQTSAQSTAYYHYIEDPAGGRVGANCATNTSANNGCATGLVCGYDKAAVNSGSTSDYVSSCGTHLDWLSANAIEALNTSATNTAPFPFSSPTYTTPAAGTVQLASLYLCNASVKHSGYSSEDASTACGCTNWGDPSFAIAGDVTFPSLFATPSQACVTNNQANGTYYWTQYVLPTIAWLKQSCPTCYTYPYDDMSSTFQCNNQAGKGGGFNSVPYTVQFNGTIPGS